MNTFNIITDALNNPINLTIVIIIVILALIDIIFKKDLKSQIVSLGVLGTFIGIFMGLQDFNPANMKESINTILIGLKTAFFTSIAGMSVALILSVIQRLTNQDMDDEDRESKILLKILDKLDRLDNTTSSDKILGELERLRVVSSDTKEATQEIVPSINLLQKSYTKENQALLFVLNTHFKKMNQSLEIAIEELSKGATEEIINALKQVIEEFNQELQSQFGENFVKLNESVINLLQWQENYKTHIEHIDRHLELSTSSIEKSKDSFEIIASKNEDIIMVYSQLQQIIFTYEQQIEELNNHLKTYSHLSSSAESMFSTITKSISQTKDEFSSLTEHIKIENRKQIEDTQMVSSEIKKRVDELQLISNHFKNIGEQIPKALQISLDALNRGLTSLTNSFQKDYKTIMDNYKNEIK